MPIGSFSAGVASPQDVDLGMRVGRGLPGRALRGAKRRDAGGSRRLSVLAESPWSAVTVVGSGHMASGIAEAVARAGRAVTVVGRTAASLDRSRASITANLDRSVGRGRLSVQDAAAIVDRIDFVPSIGDIPEDADVIIEAVAEDLPVKQAVLAQIDQGARPSAVLATNTSSYRVAEVMSDVSPQRRTLALHFFNPASVMKLVEVVPGPGERVCRRPGDRVGALTRKGAGQERRHPRIHRQPAADPVPERRRPSS